MPSLDQSNRSWYAYVTSLSVLVFIVDALTPLGYAEWAFYVLPVALCMLQSRPQLPFIVSLALMPLVLFGFILSPPGVNPTVAIVNRSLAVLTVWGVAYIARRVIVERVLAARLMWTEQGRIEVSRSMLGEPTVDEVAEKILHALARHIDAQVGVLYRIEQDALVRTATFALDPSQTKQTIPLGSGILGEAARDGKPLILRGLPGEPLEIASGTRQVLPRHLLIAPVTSEGHISGVMEFGFLKEGTFQDELKLLGLVADKIGGAIRSAQYRQHLKDLLEETQRQSEELQTQAEELRVTNEELSEQTKALQEAQAPLEIQHNELGDANVQPEDAQ